MNRLAIIILEKLKLSIPKLSLNLIKNSFSSFKNKYLVCNFHDISHAVLCSRVLAASGSLEAVAAWQIDTLTAAALDLVSCC